MVDHCGCAPGQRPDPLGPVLSHELDEGRERRQAKDWAEDAERSARAAAASAGAAESAAGSIGDSVQAAASAAAAAQQDAAQAAQAAGAAAQDAAAAQQAAETAMQSKTGVEAAAAAAAQSARAAGDSAEAAAAGAQLLRDNEAAIRGIGEHLDAIQDVHANMAAVQTLHEGMETLRGIGGDMDAILDAYANRDAIRAVPAQAAAAGQSAALAKSYAVGGTGAREDEDTDNAAYYYDQTKQLADRLSGSTVTGVKGKNEPVFRRGDVELSPDDIGAMSAADAQAALEASEQRVSEALQQAEQTVNAALEQTAQDLNESLDQTAQTLTAAMETAKQEALGKVLYLYAAALTVQGWDGGGEAGYTQTAELMPQDGGPAATAETQLGVPMVRLTGTHDTDEALLAALGLVNGGTVTPGEGTVTVKVWEKPETELTVFWYGR